MSSTARAARAGLRSLVDGSRVGAGAAVLPVARRPRLPKGELVMVIVELVVPVLSVLPGCQTIKADRVHPTELYRLPLLLLLLLFVGLKRLNHREGREND